MTFSVETVALRLTLQIDAQRRLREFLLDLIMAARPFEFGMECDPYRVENGTAYFHADVFEIPAESAGSQQWRDGFEEWCAETFGQYGVQVSVDDWNH